MDFLGNLGNFIHSIGNFFTGGQNNNPQPNNPEKQRQNNNQPQSQPQVQIPQVQAPQQQEPQQTPQNNDINLFKGADKVFGVNPSTPVGAALAPASSLVRAPVAPGSPQQVADSLTNGVVDFGRNLAISTGIPKMANQASALLTNAGITGK